MLKFKLLEKTAFSPMRAHQPGDAGIDVFAPKDFSIQPWKDEKISIEVASEFPSNYVLMVANKSGISTKNKLIVGADIIDSNYRGPIHVHLFNLSDQSVYFKRGDKIAQLLLIHIDQDEFIIVDYLSTTDRGAEGFGSTGTNISN